MRTEELPTTIPIGADEVGLLGTVLTVWAHPDDETYLAGGLLAALADAGQRAVCVTATRGEAADPGATPGERAALGRTRTEELHRALAGLGVTEHHWLDLPDGRCAEIDPAVPVACLRAVLDEVRPDTVVAFGPDGVTGHPDHRAVAGWVVDALAGWSGRPTLLHPVVLAENVGRDRALDEDFGVYELGRPRVCSMAEVTVHLDLAGPLLDRKVAALAAQASQTAGLVAAVGPDRFREWVRFETLAVPLE
ncbi:LmbE family N-acetylglucosaminyl deacetylase [Nocardioides thalensis]|uniref:LmbE family N-acetylglucosaminyl deacetylase n=1 Tax=Nocardioides thalensis TaxID=1914755 RepID=A0A853C2H5_9ACTN|nr:PIG-L family deacetylase [Nocardioides thalensis]NYJ01377.1 LmbE family N-acetylglucosaminyl deacetylase [Nocardioides thalensis]